MRFFRRSGKQVSVKIVQAVKDATAEWRRTGRGGHFPCTPQPALADCIDRMTLTEFARWSGHYSYKP